MSAKQINYFLFSFSISVVPKSEAFQLLSPFYQETYIWNGAATRPFKIKSKCNRIGSKSSNSINNSHTYSNWSSLTYSINSILRLSIWQAKKKKEMKIELSVMECDWWMDTITIYVIKIMRTWIWRKFCSIW